ncbi:MAG: Unknown protein, partial [uncultured Thiotrichaceae bacterium]
FGFYLIPDGVRHIYSLCLLESGAVACIFLLQHKTMIIEHESKT